MAKKEQLGQYYTTNTRAVLMGLEDFIPSSSTIVDPFCGEWDLLKRVDNDTCIGYDVDPKTPQTLERNTLLNPPDYSKKWVLTNPPYLYKRKSKDKKIYEKYNVDDLYKASLLSFTKKHHPKSNGCEGGVVIVPLNFICGNAENVRKEFFQEFNVSQIVVHEQQVFDDTNYTVCVLAFERSKWQPETKFVFAPEKETRSFKLLEEYGYQPGLEWHKIMSGKCVFDFDRISDNSDLSKEEVYFKLRAIDTGSKTGDINLQTKRGKEIHKDLKKSDRTFGVFESLDFSHNECKEICKRFNSRLNRLRKKYKSLFLTTYRNSTEYRTRKRIGFSQAKNLMSHVAFEMSNSFW